MILSEKTSTDTPAVKNDEIYKKLANDPTMSQFPQGTTYDYLMNMIKTQSQQPNLTAAAATTAANNAEVLVKNTNENWINKKWRPAMGWMYMCVCIFDFILAPILWAVIQFWEVQAVNDAFRQWQPLTLQGAGLFHISMGAILGIAVYGRTQEKLADAKEAAKDIKETKDAKESK